MKNFFLLIPLITPLYNSAQINKIPLGLSYGDVALEPKYTEIRSYDEICTKTHITKNITLNIPVISAGVIGITESKMAIALAQEGGLGVIHSDCDIEQQAFEVRKVKRHRGAIISDPITINVEATLEQAETLMEKHNMRTLLVINDQEKLCGILTNQDVNRASQSKKLVKELMTPDKELIVASPNITIKEAKLIFEYKKIEKIPLVYDDFTIAGLITARDLEERMHHKCAALDHEDRLLVGASVTLDDNLINRVNHLVSAHVDVIFIDQPHGDAITVIEAIKKVKNAYPHLPIIAGNVATPQAVKRLINAGADGIKIGSTAGAARAVWDISGCAYPQLSAIQQCFKEAEKFSVPLIADGGINRSGNIAVAIGAGANAVMIGTVFAGTEESPGDLIFKNGKQYKLINGLGTSFSHNPEQFVPGGIEGLIPYKGQVKKVIQELVVGLHSGMYQHGTQTIENLKGKGTFIRITPAGAHEAHPHDIILI